MIASIEGPVSEIQNDHIVILINGLGIKVFVPARITQSMELRKTIGLFTYLVVREESLTLYGFETADERDFYILLLGVNGVGPKTALGILSKMSLLDIRKAIIKEQPELFSHVPGIGKKTAQAIVFGLQGKVSVEGLDNVSRISDTDADVISALTTLGYSLIEAQSALQMISKDAPVEIEERIKLALQYFK